MTFTVAVFTSGRQDWSILRPVATAISQSPTLTLCLIAGGLHFHDAHVTELDGLRVDEQVDTLQRCDTPTAVAQSSGWTTALLAGALQRQRVDALLVAGDRTETLAAALAATCLRIPIIHLHGGEETTGAIDNACRHAISKLAHLHCVSHPDYRDRLIAMGENPERVVITGAPALDLLWTIERPAMSEWFNDLIGSPVIAFTHHPTTLGSASPEAEARIVLEGMRRGLVDMRGATIIATRANSDTGGNVINAALDALAVTDPRVTVFTSLGAKRYYSLLAHADVVIGNSSSGIIEAPTFGVPVVNIGNRQAGRVRVGHTFDAPLEAAAITQAIRSALHVSTVNPVRPRQPVVTDYGDGHACERIAKAIEGFASEAPHKRLVKEATEHVAA